MKRGQTSSKSTGAQSSCRQFGHSGMQKMPIGHLCRTQAAALDPVISRRTVPPMGTGSQCLPIAREPQNLTIPGHGGGPGTAPCANPRPPRLTAPAPIRERSGGGGRGERVDGVRATAAGQTAPPRRSAARAGGPVLGHGFGERPSGPRCISPSSLSHRDRSVGALHVPGSCHCSGDRDLRRQSQRLR